MYQIVGEIGAGGAGIIYKAYHLNLQKYVVVKKIRDHFSGVLNGRGEADILKSLHHTFLPQVYDFLQIGSGVYTVMDYIEGHDLKYYIEQGYRFDERRLECWLGQLAEVLEYLHAHKVLHLDIKPANIMITPEGNVCLIDFNVSVFDDRDSIVGISEYYASPEQYEKWNAALYGVPDKGGPLDERSDLYSLGAVFYHLMTGYLPAPHAQDMVPLRDFALPYSDEFVRIVEKMLPRAKWRRYRNAQQLSRALERRQRTRAEKRTLRFVFFGMLAGVMVLFGAFLVLAYRDSVYVSAEEREAIQAEEQYLAALCRDGEYETAYREGTSFLNREAGNVDKLSGARQSLTEQILDACLGMEEYELADGYLQQLLLMEEKPEYYQDEAVIAAWRGDFEAAEEALEKAESLGGDDTEIQVCIAELRAAGGDYPAALEIYRELNLQDTVTLRRMAVLALRSADVDLSYAGMAVEYYERLQEEDRVSYTDQMNLVTAYGLCGMDEKAEGMLRGMRAEYPDRYEICLKLGILEYNAQMKKSLAERDLTKAAEYAREALKLYEQSGEEQMDEQLAELLRLTGQEMN